MRVRLYAYVANDPINATDPDGERPIVPLDKADPLKWNGDPPSRKEIEAIREALRNIRKTKSGRKMLDKIEKSPRQCVFSKTNGGPNSTKTEIATNPFDWIAYLYTENPRGWAPGTLESQLAHELGHWLGGEDDGPGRLNNTNQYENPVRIEMDQYPRNHMDFAPWPGVPWKMSSHWPGIPYE